MRDRHRDLARNNPWVRKAIAAIVHNTIGHGVRAQWSTPEVQQRWSAWFESTAIDADGHHNGYGLQALILRTVVESGECLIRRRPRRPRDGLPLPLQIQVLEPDFLDTAKHEELANGGIIRQGVEFDRLGRRVAYWLYPEHPGDAVRGVPGQSKRYGAEAFLHVYRLDRPGQVRGVPWGTGAMLRARMLDDYQDAQLERQRLAACYVAFVRDTELPADAAPLDDYELLDRLEPGAIELLPAGKDVSFASPPQPEDDERFTNQTLRAIAADYGIPFEVLTGDLSEVNFSSARMGQQEFARAIDVWRWQLLAPQAWDPIARWFAAALALDGLAPAGEPRWSAPARTLVDPSREIPALRTAIRAGLISLPEAIRQAGYDPETLARDQAAYLDVLDRLGVRFDSDAREGRVG
ncbi:portal protein [Marichromatium purpuratum 984]|uniref:Portal protein n=1 Tax=Marichromatium purpuratum 984 TaxID=765910 RepID=W0DY98_MARPU|nr:portal protein [Marichromatium purpuratum 984]